MAYIHRSKIITKKECMRKEKACNKGFCWNAGVDDEKGVTKAQLSYTVVMACSVLKPQKRESQVRLTIRKIDSFYSSLARCGIFLLL